jgi:hypothetical protein
LEYNKCICMGIVAFKKNDFDLAIEYFGQAVELDKNRTDPHFYMGIALTRKAALIKDRKLLQKSPILEEAVKKLSRAA